MYSKAEKVLEGVLNVENVYESLRKYKKVCLMLWVNAKIWENVLKAEKVWKNQKVHQKL